MLSCGPVLVIPPQRGHRRGKPLGAPGRGQIGPRAPAGGEIPTGDRGEKAGPEVLHRAWDDSFGVDDYATVMVRTSQLRSTIEWPS